VHCGYISPWWLDARGGDEGGRPAGPGLSIEPTLVPKLRITFADFPYLHSETGRQEAANLGDLLRYCGTFAVAHAGGRRRGVTLTIFKCRCVQRQRPQRKRTVTLRPALVEVPAWFGATRSFHGH